jgi:hypothetical protein
MHMYTCIDDLYMYIQNITCGGSLKASHTVDLPILIAAAAAVSVSLAASDGATLSLISASCTQ